MKKAVHILLVDDDEVDVMNVKQAFAKNKVLNPFQVATNGLEALELLRTLKEKEEQLPGIILLDLNMPKMGGIEFLRHLRADQDLKSIAVFVMTTSSEEQDKVAAYNLNVAGYILKPLSFENFAQATFVLKNYWGLCEQL